MFLATQDPGGMSVQPPASKWDRWCGELERQWFDAAEPWLVWHLGTAWLPLLVFLALVPFLIGGPYLRIIEYFFSVGLFYQGGLLLAALVLARLQRRGWPEDWGPRSLLGLQFGLTVYWLYQCFEAFDDQQRAGHLAPLIVGLVLAPAVVAWFRPPWKWNATLPQIDYRAVFQAARNKPACASFGTNLLLGPIRSPIEIAMPAAVAVLLAAGYGVPEAGVAVVGLLTSWVLLAFVRSRRELAWVGMLLRRLFLYGGCWAVSLLVLVLAACVLGRVSYVTTVLEVDGWLIFAIVVFGYLCGWLLELWLNHALNRQLRCLLDQTGALAATVSVRGATHLAISVGQDSPVFIRRRALLRGLDDEAGGDMAWAPVQDRCHAFFARTYFVLVFAVVMATVVRWMCLPGEPLLALSEGANEGTYDVPTRLFREQSQTRSRVILIAASGGGTRAAVYTASLLHGLSELDALEDVQLVSGVSGGGVALAYFAAHRESLVNGSRADRDDAWKRFYGAMAAPHILKVLPDAGSLRVAWTQPLGSSLEASFDEHFYPPKGPGRPYRTLDQVPIGIILNTTLLGEYPPDFRCDGADFLTRIVAFWPWRSQAGGNSYKHRSEASGRYHGTRLVLTNLAGETGLADAAAPLRLGEADPPEPGAPTPLRFRILRRAPREPAAAPASDGNTSNESDAKVEPAIPLIAAAALTANFPPIFPNAPIDVQAGGHMERYWVTDGGALENRGDVALLYVLRQALEFEKNRRETWKDNTPPASLPSIHVIVAEASAVRTAYSASPVGPLSAGKAPLADGLCAALWDQIKALYAEMQEHNGEAAPGREILYHSLDMPAVLRVDGGIGTHWMLPDKVTLAPKMTKAAQAGEPLELSKDAVLDAIWNLHVRDAARQRNVAKRTPGEMQTLDQWLACDQFGSHKEAWDGLVAKLTRLQTGPP